MSVHMETHQLDTGPVCCIRMPDIACMECLHISIAKTLLFFTLSQDFFQLFGHHCTELNIIKSTVNYNNFQSNGINKLIKPVYSNFQPYSNKMEVLKQIKWQF